MKLYIDFDGTLYNTDKFYQTFLNICQEYNIYKEEIDEIKQKIFKKSLFNLDKLVNYLIENKKVNQTFLEKVNNLYNPLFLFDDVLESLNILKNKYQLYLLTFGDILYQKRKIEGVKIKKYFKDIIIVEEDKSNLKMIDYENSLFIDNNPCEIEKFYNVKGKVIRLRRKEDKYSKIPTTINCLECENLKEFIKLNNLD